jgi:hypothetical protein
MCPEVSGQIDPSNLRVVRVINDAEYRHGRPSPDLRMILYGHNIIALGIPIRCARFDLEGNAKRRDSGFIGKVNVSILAEIMLLADFLKGATVMLKK